MLLVAVLLASCNNDRYGMVTVVNRDGSCRRELTFHLDSAQLVSGKLDPQKTSVRLDSSWKLTWSLKGETARHAFPMTRAQYDSINSVISGKRGQMNDEVSVKASSSWNQAQDMGRNTILVLKGFKIVPQTKLTCTFKWFYTDYDYRETYPKRSVAFKIPLTKYLSRDEIGYWYAGRPDLGKGMSGYEQDDLMEGIKDKYSKWLSENFFEWSYEAIEKNYGAVAGAPVSKQQFMALHDSLSRFFAQKDDDVKDLKEDQVSHYYLEFFHSDAYAAVLNNDRMMAEQQKTIEDFVQLSNLTIDYQLRMPGEITNDGGGIVGKETIHYRLSGNRLLPGDYAIMARSRVTNVWAFALTGLVLALTVILLFVRRHRTHI